MNRLSSTDPGGIRLLRRLCFAAAGADLVLFGVKLWAGVATSSIGIYSDGINNLLDAVTACIAVLGTFLMAREPDARFPRGYGKAEHLVSFVGAALIALTGGYISYTSVERLMYPRPVNFQVLYAVLVAASAVVKLAMWAFFRSFYKKRIDSVIVRTIAADSLADACVTVVILLTFIVTHVGGPAVDALAGVALGIFIIVGAVGMLRSAAFRLMDGVDPGAADPVVSEFAQRGFDVKVLDCSRNGAVIDSPEPLPDEVVAAVEEQCGSKIYYRRNINVEREKS